MKKRGFTLVEVITIIAILGVIALIATPIVLNQIEDARRETFKASVRNVFDAVTSYLAHNEDVDDIPVTGIFIPDSDIYKKLNLKNEKFTDGLIYRDDNRVITVSCITDGTYYASGSKNELEVSKGSCDPLDETKPHIKLYVSRVTSSSITVLVDSEDKESGIVSYEYYLGEELKATIKDNIYKFTDLEKDKEYDIKVRVVNGNNQEAEDTIKAKTGNNGINWKETPEGWARSKTVTINYPSMEENEIYKYKRVGIDKEWILVNENKVDILLEDDTTITAIVERNGKQILSDTGMFAVDREPPEIKEPIEGNLDEWTTSKRIVVNAIDGESGLAEKPYSFDGGLTWQKSNVKIYTSIESIIILVKDKVGNVAQKPLRVDLIDSTIPKSHKITATIGNSSTEYKSGVWTNQDVVLKANPNPSSTQSGYIYKWYEKKDSKYELIKGVNKQKLTKGEDVVATYKVSIATGAGAGPIDSSNTYVVKIDKTPPTTKAPTVSNIKTNSVKVKHNQQDTGSGLDTTTLEYGYSTSRNGTYTWTTSDNITGLTNNKTYYIKTKVNDKVGNGVTESEPTTITTKNFTAPSWNYNDEDADWAKSKTLKVTYYNDNVPNPVYFLKSSVAGTTSWKLYGCTTDSSKNPTKSACTTSVAAGSKISKNTWYMLTDTKSQAQIKITSNGTLYALTSDGNNYSSQSTAEVNKIDTPPELTLRTPITTTESITIPFTAEDPESGIRETTCVYGKSKSYGKNGKVDGNKCILSNLTAGTKYYYKVTTTNNSDLSTSATGSATTGTTGVEFSIKQTPKDTDWATSKAVTVKYTTENVTESVRYVKTDVATTSSVNGYACGKKEDPGKCVSTATKSFEKDYWYKVESDPVVTFTSNGTLYAKINDGAIYSAEGTQKVNKIDTSKPSLTLDTPTKTTESITIPFTASDAESGISKTTCVYGKSKSYGKNGKVDGNKCILSNLTAGTKYYYKVTTTNNSDLSTSATGSATTGTTGVEFSIKQTPKDTDWATSKAVTVKYTTENVTESVRYVKTDVATTSSVNGYACGKKEDPGKCVSTATKSFEKDYWYKVESDPVVTFTSNGTLYAKINDGAIYSAEGTQKVNKIDTSTPTVTITAVKVEKTGDNTKVTNVNVSSKAWVKTGTVDNPHGVKMTANTSTSASGYKSYEWQRYNENTKKWENLKKNKNTYTTTYEQKNKQYRVYVTNNAGTTAVSKPFVVNIDNCQNTKTTSGDYSTCNPACGDGTKTRTVTKTGISGRKCSTSKETEECNNGACKCSWFMEIDESNSNFLSYGLKFTGDTTTGSCALKTVERVKVACYDLNPNGGKTEVGCNTKYFDFRDTKPIYLKSVGAWYDYVEIGEDVMWGDAAQMTVKYKATYNNGNTSAVTYYFFAYGITTEFWGKKLENKEITIDEVGYWYVYYDW